MKILFVSMPSIHVTRWIDNLKDTPYELYWFDILGRGKLDTKNTVTQFVDWKNRKVRPIKGEYFLSKKYPKVYQKIQSYLEVTANEAIEKIIQEIQPDIVHSFELHYCSLPILKTMKKYKNLKWIYSCWGNDIYRHQVLKSDIKKISSVLGRVNYLITDCKRDYYLAKKNGFKGDFLGVIPGGAGYHSDDIKSCFEEPKKRKIILIKGYQNEIGRAIFALKAIKLIVKSIENFDVYVFSARGEVFNYIQSDVVLSEKIQILRELTQLELFEYFGKSFIYIGNNISDGMPNTLLQALLLGAYPIQSNPGNATKELIGNKYFGSIIDNPENPDEIATKILYVINNRDNILPLVKLNHENAIKDYDYNKIKNLIIKMYNFCL